MNRFVFIVLFERSARTGFPGMNTPIATRTIAVVNSDEKAIAVEREAFLAMSRIIGTIAVKDEVWRVVSVSEIATLPD